MKKLHNIFFLTPQYYVHYKVQFNYGETTSRQKKQINVQELQ